MRQTIFFSWQSDRQTRICRNFIESALIDAIKRVAADASVDKSPREDLAIDRDTQNVPGSPPIFDTILTKIEKATIFVPDLTFVGTRDGGRPIPNPNVLIEYGYALNQHGSSRVIAVMNTAFGEPSQENMPFNLGHRRFPIRYELFEDAVEETRRAVRASLIKELASAIKLVFDSEDFKTSSQAKPVLQRRTVIDEAEDYANEVDYQYALSALDSGSGLEKVRTNVRALFAEIAKRCTEINGRGRVQIEFEAKPWGEREVDNFCWIRSRPIATQVYWRQPFAGSAKDAALFIAGFSGPIILPSEMGRLMSFDQPRKLSTKTFVPYLSRESDIGWAEKKPNMLNASFISNEDFAEACLTDFFKHLRSATSRT